MNNYEIADEIRAYQKKSKKYSKASTALWILAATSITVASGCKVAESFFNCKARQLYDKLDI